MYRKIKFHYPLATVVEATIRGHLPPKPGDVVMVFDPNSVVINNFTILVSIDNGYPTGERFIAPISLSDSYVHHWTYAYRVPEGYASVETSND